MSGVDLPIVPLPVVLTNDDKDKIFRAAVGVLVVYSAGLAINSSTTPGTAEHIGVFGFVLLLLYKMSRNIDSFIVNITGGRNYTGGDGSEQLTGSVFEKLDGNVLDSDFSKLDEQISGLVSKEETKKNNLSIQIVAFFSKLSDFFSDNKLQLDSTLLTKTILNILEDKSLNDLKQFFSYIGESIEIKKTIDTIKGKYVSIIPFSNPTTNVVGGKKGKRSLSKKRKSSMKKRKGGKRSGKNQK